MLGETGSDAVRTSGRFALTGMQIAWLAGLLEGEGCFTTRRRQPGAPLAARVQINMTDEDVIARVAEMFGVRYQTIAANGRRKAQYRVAIVGASASELMTLVSPLMGSHRRARIAELLTL